MIKFFLMFDKIRIRADGYPWLVAKVADTTQVHILKTAKQDMDWNVFAANAALIKSAPEMYEMLEYWLQEAVYSMNYNMARWIRSGLSKESLLEDAKTKKAIENIRRTKQILKNARGE